MRRSEGAHGTAKGVLSGLISAGVQLGIIGGLLYAALFVKAEVKVPEIATPPIEKRDVFYGVATPKPGVVWAVGNLGKVVRSEDDGQHFQIQTVPTKVGLQSIAAWDDLKAVAVGNGAVVITTDDGGRTWTSAEAPKSEVVNKLLRVVALEGGKAWAVGQMGALLASKDYGRSWERRAEEQDVAWNDIKLEDTLGWVVGEFGKALRSTDGGASWQSLQTPVKASLMAVEFRDANNGVAVGVAGTLITTADGGQTWQTVRTGTREHLLDVMWDGQRWVAVGDKGVLLTSDANALKWKVGKVAENHLGWYTRVIATPTGYMLSGSNLSRLQDNTLSVLGRHS